jgi:gamma-glutamyltranspeptidase/glutathione hydrolase
MLEAGGNAVDAAVATVFAVGVAAQESCGIGGGGFLLYRGADGTAAALDFRETAPAELLEPAIALAEQGVRMGRLRTEVLKAESERLAVNDEARRLYLDADGGAPVSRPGENRAVTLPPVGWVRPQRDLAETLRTLARNGPDAFYRGSIGAAIVAEMDRSRNAGVPAGERGVMTAEDLAAYRPVWREPLQGSYRGRTVLAAPPPTAGGVMILETLNLLEGFPLGRAGFRHGSANQLHVLAEAKKIVAADRDAYGAYADLVGVPTDELIAGPYADRRRGDIDPARARSPQAGVFAGFTPRPPTAGKPAGASTHHVSVVDRAGNAVAVTCTIEQRYGSGVVVPGTGILLNNEMTDFDGPGSANEVRAGKRPRSSISPVIVVDGGRPALVLGASGGLRIPMGVVNVVSNVIDHGMSPALAVDAARVDAERCCDLELEGKRVSAAARHELTRRGHTIVDRGEYHPLFVPLVHVTGVMPDGRRFAVSDPRYQRGATGY